MASVLVFLDVPALPLPRAARELLTLAGSVGEPVVASARPLETELAEALAAHGARKVYEPAGDLDTVLVAAKAAFLAEAATAEQPAAILLGNSFEDREIAARTGIKLGSGVITDAVAVAPDLAVTKSVLAGSWTSTCRVQAGTPIITVKANSVEPADAVEAGAPARIELPVPEAGPAARVTGRTGKRVSGRPELAEARVIVAGGRGMDGNFGPVEELADLLGGAVGASRAATDAGWIEHSAQVGQTGKTVSPQLYISAGISGAIQQKAGMQTAQVIVAVNKDADAPVFEIADFGVVGDVFSVLPQAAAEIRKRRA
ncbi:electron transfer flavoprotein subunit alpha/FixB family protein [Arthrobacter sp. zg-Y40]|uniref:electron transfer flavoprotein subunit alpha/FixB family protein n=1 Tax=unclassified Arthrobacter TaxID=235627 RepID=UPI001D15053F|nr:MULTISPECIES: electron transfer flavoprotein subunit alpha/FixB family protein [unclassified Arthrobacter]MCC3276809.1 electron transfer flavoprotein subunit alpha/FixB family protein [Arthrobacter sp. zg-Y20]MCC3277760.1 electron transfer flavoprotein subunit alpha/FixB family protein [Arthrobacter sp. zg-Y40]MDK1316969.1 electron transfer flavoprotein subunit alpha/FixB family protein [Arthrobacter sp. zg.Y20]WIB05317.1 electron transfer flavoprotein subunit alpha/FixB family protein [Arth